MLFSPCECSWGEIYHQKRHIWKEKVVILSSLSLLTHISLFILSAKYPRGWWATWERIERNIEQERNKLKRFISLKKLWFKWTTGTVILSWYSEFFIVSNHIQWGNSHCICTSVLIYPVPVTNSPKCSGQASVWLHTYPVIIPGCWKPRYKEMEVQTSQLWAPGYRNSIIWTSTDRTSEGWLSKLISFLLYLLAHQSCLYVYKYVCVCV